MRRILLFKVKLKNMDKKLYDKINNFWEKYPDLYWWDKLDIRYKIIDYLYWKKFNDVLDLGWQTAIFSKFIKFKEYICVDKTEIKDKKNNIIYVKDDFLHFLENDNKKYDLILAVHIIEYIPWELRENFLLKLKDKLTETWELILTDLNKNNYFYKNYSEWYWYYNNDQIKNLIHKVFDWYNINFIWWDQINIRWVNFLLWKYCPLLAFKMYNKISTKYSNSSRTWWVVISKVFISKCWDKKPPVSTG